MLDDAYGLVFRQQKDDTYMLLQLDGGGRACVLTLGDMPQSNDAPCPSQRLGRHSESNHLVVVTENGAYVFVVNDHLIGRAGDVRLEKGLVGVFVSLSESKDMTFEFDNFQLYIPPQ